MNDISDMTSNEILYQDFHELITEIEKNLNRKLDYSIKESLYIFKEDLYLYSSKSFHSLEIPNLYVKNLFILPSLNAEIIKFNELYAHKLSCKNNRTIKKIKFNNSIELDIFDISNTKNITTISNLPITTLTAENSDLEILFNCPLLKNLYANNSKLKTIKTTPNLKKAILNNNPQFNFNNFNKLNNLQELEINNNKLITDLSHLNQLKKLSYKNYLNDVFVLPPNLIELDLSSSKEIIKLELSEQQLKILKLNNCPKLKSLTIKSTNHQTKQVIKKAEIKKLSICHTNIKELTEGSISISQLNAQKSKLELINNKELVCFNNRGSHVDKVIFENCESLRKVYLNNDNISLSILNQLTIFNCPDEYKLYDSEYEYFILKTRNDCLKIFVESNHSIFNICKKPYFQPKMYMIRDEMCITQNSMIILHNYQYNEFITSLFFKLRGINSISKNGILNFDNLSNLDCNNKDFFGAGYGIYIETIEDFKILLEKGYITNNEDFEILKKNKSPICNHYEKEFISQRINQQKSKVPSNNKLSTIAFNNDLIKRLK